MRLMFKGGTFAIIAFLLVITFLMAFLVSKNNNNTASLSVTAQNHTKRNLEPRALNNIKNAKLSNDYSAISDKKISENTPLNPTPTSTIQPTPTVIPSSNIAQELITERDRSPEPTIFNTPTPPSQNVPQQDIATPTNEPVQVPGCESNGSCLTQVSPTPEPEKTQISTTICGKVGKYPQPDVCLE